MVWEIKAELALSDYEVNSSNFDAQLKSKMSALIEAAPRWEEALKLEISGFIDFISKDQNYYLLLQELNIVDEWWIEEIEEFIQTMSDIAATNKYIHFEDDASQEAMEILKTFSPQSILAEGNEIVSQPLFKAYKKVWEKYYLIPTKYACDTAKELAEKFDPFNGSDCTQGQYDSMLEDLADTKMEFYIELWANTTIGFEADEIEDDIEEFNWSISFSSNYIEELNILIKPDQNQYPDEWGEISYKRNSYLNASFYNERSESDIKLLSTLDSNNRFTSIDADITSDGFVWNLDLANKKISWKYSLESWNDTWNWNISGKMDNTNQLSELDITSNISNTGEYSPFENTSRFEYNKWQMKVVNNFASEWYKSNFNISASWNPTKNEIVAWNLGLDVYTKDSSYDYDTYTTIYSGDFKKVFDTQMTLNNKAIEWKTTVISDWTVLLSVDHSWNYEKDYFKLHNNFTTELYSFLLWTDSKTTGNINIELDQRNNKNNWNLYIDINLNASQVLELEIDNKSKKEFKDINIVAPTNTVELEEVIELPQY